MKYRPYGLICELPENENYYRYLCGSIHGTPFYVHYAKPHNYNRGSCLEVGKYIKQSDKDAVNSWQAESDNDCLRARGDIRWTAACTFTAKPVYLMGEIMKKEIKHDPSYDEAITKAEIDFRNPDGKEMKDKCPYLYSSNMADVYWITAYSLYWTGRKPFKVCKSRGNSWLIDYPGHGILKVKVIAEDHRNGIKIIN